MVNWLRLARYLVFALVLIFSGTVAYFESRHWRDYGHLAPIGLHADIEVHSGAIGIPGITKTYEAILTNYGMLPASIEKCSYTSDVSGIFTKVAYNIERWDAKQQVWIQAENFAKPGFCSPFPFSTANTRWGHLWLRPGESLSTEEEATGARDSFKKGDRLRFVVVSEVTNPDGGHSYPTAAFTLDEQMVYDGVPYRVKH